MGKRVLLVEPSYYTCYPPLGLLKLATYFRSIKYHKVELARGCKCPDFYPDEIYVTSLFTYSWKAVHDAVRFYKTFFPKSKVILGGIYASLLPEHAAKSGADEIYEGVFKEAELCVPAWDLVPEWDGSVIFTSRGCIRKCPFCAVPKIEGGLKETISSIKPYIHPGHRRVILWDNNILATRHWRRVFQELRESGKWVDFNQGLDARLITPDVAKEIASLKIKFVRIAYDHRNMKEAVSKAISNLNKAGVRGKSIVVYTLYNYKDDPEDFRERVAELLNWGVVSYPMRYEPVTSLKKNSFVSDLWTMEELEMVAKARRVLGYAGALPPYEGLVKKFTEAKNFHEAFALRNVRRYSRRKRDVLIPRGIPLLL